MIKNHTCKILAVGIIVLFIGVGFHPAFAVDTNISNVSLTKDTEFVSIPVQIHTSKGIQKHTLELTNQQVEELDRIFDKLKIDLWDCNSQIEVIEIYKEAIVSLDENGLLPDWLSVEEAQELLLKNNLSLRFGKLFYRLFNNPTKANLLNFFCSISGETNFTGNSQLSKFLKRIGTLYLGMYEAIGYGMYYPAEGWIYTKGLLGVNRIEGSFLGRIFYLDDPPFDGYYIGVIGFYGVLYEGQPCTEPSNFIGSAFWIKIS